MLDVLNENQYLKLSYNNVIITYNNVIIISQKR